MSTEQLQSLAITMIGAALTIHIMGGIFARYMEDRKDDEEDEE